MHMVDILLSYIFFNQSSKVLDYVDVFAADEDPKYCAPLKTKSPVLFWLYIRFVHLKAKLHRSTTND